MDKQGQFIIVFAGLLGLVLAILTGRPRKVVDALLMLVAGMFGALILAPAFAEALTRFAGAFPTFSWLDAKPGTAMFTAIVGVMALLGGQIVVALKADFIEYVRTFGRRRMGIDVKSRHEHES